MQIVNVDVLGMIMSLQDCLKALTKCKSVKQTCGLSLIDEIPQEVQSRLRRLESVSNNEVTRYSFHSAIDIDPGTFFYAETDNITFNHLTEITMAFCTYLSYSRSAAKADYGFYASERITVKEGLEYLISVLNLPNITSFDLPTGTNAKPKALPEPVSDPSQLDQLRVLASAKTIIGTGTEKTPPKRSRNKKAAGANNAG
jgi:hypothetical protein